MVCTSGGYLNVDTGIDVDYGALTRVLAVARCRPGGGLVACPDRRAQIDPVRLVGLSAAGEAERPHYLAAVPGTKLGHGP